MSGFDHYFNDLPLDKLIFLDSTNTDVEKERDITQYIRQIDHSRISIYLPDDLYISNQDYLQIISKDIPHHAWLQILEVFIENNRTVVVLKIILI